ncbi:MAG TPA: hypothetical protein VJV23_02900 [Candidatus Polarisedimenticolia bacterium]|nr:hypothetical protein [Candidatus Polarisedimenticolia bacterium]
MNRKKREGRLDRGDELLEARGIDLDADDEQLLPALVAAIGSDPDADLSIADWMGSIPSEESARRLVEWERSRPADKDLRRTLKASLFRLQQRGIAAAAREEEPSEPVRLVEKVEPSGWLSPLDGGGSRLAWLSRPRPEGGVLVLSSIVNDRAGMRQVGERATNKSGLKETFADLASHGAPMVQAPGRHVDWLMSEAYRRGAPRDERGGGYPLLRADFYTDPASPVPSPLDDLGPLEPAQAGELLETSSTLYEEQEMAGWVLPEDMVKVHHARFRDAQDSSLVLSKDQMTERLTGVIDQAFEEVIEKEARTLYAARFGEMALWFHLARREGPARRCLALHQALSDPGRRLKEISFLRAMAFTSFLHLLPRDAPEGAGREADADPSSLIVRP